MKYYIVSAEVAERLGVRQIRFGNTEKGYLVNQSDLAVIGIEEAVSNGAKEQTSKEAETFIKNL